MHLHFRKSDSHEHVHYTDVNTNGIAAILLHFFVEVYLTKMFARTHLHEYFVRSRDLTEITLARVLRCDICNTCYLSGALLLQNSTKFSLRQVACGPRNVL